MHEKPSRPTAWFVALVLILSASLIAACGGPKQTAGGGGTPPPAKPPSGTTPAPPAGGSTTPSAPAGSTPAGEGEGRTIDTAVGKNITVQCDIDRSDGKFRVEVTLLELLSGDPAWDKVYAANKYNAQPKATEEYILAKFRVKVLDAPAGKVYKLNHAKFDLFDTEGSQYQDFTSVAGVEPDLRFELAKGTEHTGYTYFMARKNDTAPTAAFEAVLDKAPAWFRLR